MRALSRLAQQENSSARHNFTTVTHKSLKHLLEVENAWLTINQSNNIDAKDILHLRLCEKVVEHYLANFATLDFYYNAHAIFVRFVAQL